MFLKETSIKDRLFIAGITLYFLIGGLYLWPSRRPFDFYRFAAIPREARRLDIQDIYSDRARQRITAGLWEAGKAPKSRIERTSIQGRFLIEPMSTPFFWACSYLATTGHYDFDYAVFRWISLLLFATGLVTLLRFLEYPWPAVLIGCVAVTAAFWPYKLEVAYGNVNQIQTGVTCFALILLAADQPVSLSASGLLMGLLAGWKPNLALWPILMLVDAAAQRRFQRAAWICAGLAVSAVIVLALPILVLGDMATWTGWHRMMTDWYPAYRYYRHSSFLYVVFGSQNSALFNLLAIALGLSTLGLAFKTGLGLVDWDGFEPRLERAILLSGVGVGAFMFSSPLVHGHYALLLFPLFAVLMRPGYPGTSYLSPARWLAIASLLMLAAHPVLWKLGLIDSELTPTPVYFLGAAIPVVLGCLRLISQAREGRLASIAIP